MWSSLLSQPCIEGTRFKILTDLAALKWMLHMDAAHEILARLRLHLAEFDYVVHSTPGASDHAVHTLARISTPAADECPVPDQIPWFALLN